MIEHSAQPPFSRKSLPCPLDLMPPNQILMTDFPFLHPTRPISLKMRNTCRYLSNFHPLTSNNPPLLRKRLPYSYCADSASENGAPHVFSLIIPPCLAWAEDQYASSLLRTINLNSADTVASRCDERITTTPPIALVPVATQQAPAPQIAAFHFLEPHLLDIQT